MDEDVTPEPIVETVQKPAKPKVDPYLAPHAKRRKAKAKAMKKYYQNAASN